MSDPSLATDVRVRGALAELRELVAARFPGATFTVVSGEDPPGVYLRPEVDIEDLDEVVDVVIERLMEMHLDEDLPVYVFPTWPRERVLAQARLRAG